MPRLTVDTDVDMSEPLSKQQLQRAVATLAGPYEVVLKPINPKRSNQANRFYWRVVCQTLAEWFTQQGQPMCKEQAHVMLAEEFNGVPFVNPKTGELIRMLPGSTSALGVEQFSTYLENCMAWMSVHGIELPPPPAETEGRKQTKRIEHATHP